MIGMRQIGYFNYLVMGETLLRVDQMVGLRWDEKLNQVVMMAAGGRQYNTGYSNKEEFLAYIKPPARKKKKGEVEE